MAKVRGQYHARATAEINITPLIDVMLVLLMILMLAAPVMAHQVTVNLPQIDNRDAPPPPRVHVRVAADGAITWDGVSLTSDGVAAQIAYEAKRDPQPVIEIDAHDAVAYERVVALAAQLDAGGIDTLGFTPRR